MTNEQCAGEPSDWQLECQTAVVRVFDLISFSKRELSPSCVIELMRALPRSEEEIQQIGDADTPLARCLHTVADRDLVGEVKEFIRFMQHIAAMPPERRELLEASVVGVLMGLGLSE